MVKKEIKCCNCGEIKAFCCCTPIGTLCKECLDLYADIAKKSIKKIEKTENETDLMEKLGDEYEVFSEERVLSIEEIEKWFNKESSYGKCIFSVLQEEDFESCKKLVLEIAKYQKFSWKHVIGFMVLA